MKISSLTLTNFRGFAKRSFTFSDEFNVFIGDNATGKTAVLDALSIAVGSFLLGIEDTNSRNIHKNEIRICQNLIGQTATFEKQMPVVVQAKGKFLDNTEILKKNLVNEEGQEKLFENNVVSFHLQREISKLGGRTTRKDASLIEKIAKTLQDCVRENTSNVNLPVLSYHGTGRLWLQKRSRDLETKRASSRMLGYKDCLDAESNEKELMRWFKKMELQSLQRQRQGKSDIGVLMALRGAIQRCLENCRSIYFDFDLDELVFEFDIDEPDTTFLPFRMLSDGQREIIGVVADIAHRAAVLNPHLQENAPQESEGVVLIDEIDLHLHPKWQRRVIADLRRTFPKIQFFVTTHSPFIIQSLLPEDCVIDLAEPEEHQRVSPEEYVSMSIEDIAEEPMGVEIPQRSQRYQEMKETAKRYYELIHQAKSSDKEEIATIKRRLDELSALYSDDPAYSAFLEMERVAAGLSSNSREKDDGR